VSALTKIFVVLNVILSLLLASAAIVYVNTQSTTSTQLTNAQTQNKQLSSDNASLKAAVAAKDTERLDMSRAKDEQINQLRAELAAKEQLLAKSESQNLELTSSLAQASAVNTSSSEALKMAQAVIGERATSYDKLRGDYDNLQKNLAETSLALDNSINSADVTRKQLLVANEQIAQLNLNLSKLNDTVRKYNIPVTENSNQINTDPGVDVTAKVQEVRTIGGVRYATINVGSADSVAKNMRFKIVDPGSKQWLGYIVLDTVNIHDSYGRLDGPQINQVQQGAIVRSKF